MVTRESVEKDTDIPIFAFGTQFIGHKSGGEKRPSCRGRYDPQIAHIHESVRCDSIRYVIFKVLMNNFIALHGENLLPAQLREARRMYHRLIFKFDPHTILKSFWKFDHTLQSIASRRNAYPKRKGRVACSYGEVTKHKVRILLPLVELNGRYCYTC